MNNPIAKVCRIIESCETEEQLTVARRVGQRVIKQHPGCASLIWSTIQYTKRNLLHVVSIEEFLSCK